MQISSNLASAILISIGVFIMSSPSHARLGEGPRIDELTASADVVCAGRIVGYETVDVTGENNGNHSMWLAARFAADHKIKGSFPTNDLMILMNKLKEPERAKDILAQLGGEKRISRFLVFLKATDIKKSQFKLVDDMNGMIQVSSITPPIEEEAGTEKRIEVEMAQGLKQLGPAQQEQIRTMSERWQGGKHAVTNKQKKIRDSGH